MVTILSAASLVGVLSVALALSSLLSLLRIGAIFCVAALALTSSTGVDRSLIPDCFSSF